MDFNTLSTKISLVHTELKRRAKASVNSLHTIRNWMIGYYTVTYEQNGSDRAKYGDRLIKNLASDFSAKGIKDLSFTSLNIFRQFYLTYPQIIQTLSEQFKFQTVKGQIPSIFFIKEVKEIGKLGNIQTVSEQLGSHELQIPPNRLITSLSFSHFVELIKIKDSLKRTFYELETIKGTWSVRELKRQIVSLYFERSGLSLDKEKLCKLVNINAETENISLSLRNPMIFEFLDLPLSRTLEENQLERALMDNLQAFLLELGYGFCFEARQKRILIDDEYFYIDLVFYHRILKCHVLIELKTEGFTHENMGQLNVYLQYYKHKIMGEEEIAVGFEPTTVGLEGRSCGRV